MDEHENKITITDYYHPDEAIKAELADVLHDAFAPTAWNNGATLIENREHFSAIVGLHARPDQSSLFKTARLSPGGRILAIGIFKLKGPGITPPCQPPSPPTAKAHKSQAQIWRDTANVYQDVAKTAYAKDELPQDVYHLSYLATMAAHQGKGLGRSIIASHQETMRGDQVPMKMSISSGSEGSTRLYLSLGFRRLALSVYPSYPSWLEGKTGKEGDGESVMFESLVWDNGLEPWDNTTRRLEYRYPNLSEPIVIPTIHAVKQ